MLNHFSIKNGSILLAFVENHCEAIVNWLVSSFVVVMVMMCIISQWKNPVQGDLSETHRERDIQKT